MASISLQNIKPYTYVYVSESYRDELKRPRNQKIKIGKIDHITKELIISPGCQGDVSFDIAMGHNLMSIDTSP